jgi:hypothetical protein
MAAVQQRGLGGCIYHNHNKGHAIKPSAARKGPQLQSSTRVADSKSVATSVIDGQDSTDPLLVERTYEHNWRKPLPGVPSAAARACSAATQLSVVPALFPGWEVL